jgi:hypothetical protein
VKALPAPDIHPGVFSWPQAGDEPIDLRIAQPTVTNYPFSA